MGGGDGDSLTAKTPRRGEPRRHGGTETQIFCPRICANLHEEKNGLIAAKRHKRRKSWGLLLGVLGLFVAKMPGLGVESEGRNERRDTERRRKDGGVCLPRISRMTRIRALVFIDFHPCNPVPSVAGIACSGAGIAGFGPVSIGRRRRRPATNLTNLHQVFCGHSCDSWLVPRTPGRQEKPRRHRGTDFSATDFTDDTDSGARFH